MKIKILLFTLVVATVANASVLTAEMPEKLAISSKAYSPVLNPEGNILLFSTQDHLGLNALDLRTNNLTIIDEGVAAGFNPVFSPDGNEVYYRTATIVDGLMNRDVRQYDLVSNTKTQLFAPNRKAMDLRSIKSNSYSYSYSDYDHINVVIRGEKTEITPLPDAHSYLWASLSPAGDKILFTEPFTGVYVCDIDGSNPQRLVNRGDYPCWLGDSYVLTVVSKDDGQDIFESRIVAIALATGETIDLTSPDVIVTEIATAENANKVAFSTITGDMYIMNLKISQ